MKRLLENPRGLRMALVISVAVNIFLATLLATQLGKTMVPHKWPDVEVLEKRLAARLSAPDAEILHQIFQAHRAELTLRAAAVKQARTAVKRALQSEPFTSEALTAAFTKTRAAVQSLQEALHATIVKAAAELSASGRQRLFQEREDRR